MDFLSGIVDSILAPPVNVVDLDNTGLNELQLNAAPGTRAKELASFIRTFPEKAKDTTQAWNASTELNEKSFQSWPIPVQSRPSFDASNPQLDSLLAVASSIFSWLEVDHRNTAIIVSTPQCRGNAILTAAAVWMFSGQKHSLDSCFSTYHSAQHGAFASTIDAMIHSPHHYLEPVHFKYGLYVQTLIAKRQVPFVSPLCLNRVVMHSAPTINHKRVELQVTVWSDNKLVWSSAWETSHEESLQNGEENHDGLVYKASAGLYGDVTIRLHMLHHENGVVEKVAENPILQTLSAETFFNTCFSAPRGGNGSIKLALEDLCLQPVENLKWEKGFSLSLLCNNVDDGGEGFSVPGALASFLAHTPPRAAAKHVPEMAGSVSRVVLFCTEGYAGRGMAVVSNEKILLLPFHEQSTAEDIIAALNREDGAHEEAGAVNIPCQSIVDCRIMPSTSPIVLSYTQVSESTENMMNSKSRNENSDADSQDGEYCSGREQESSTSTEDAQQTSVAHRAGAKVSGAARLAASASKGDESGCGTPTSTMRRQLRAMSQDNKTQSVNAGKGFVRVVWSEGDDMRVVALFDRHPDGSAEWLYRLIVHGPAAAQNFDGESLLLEMSEVLDESLSRYVSKWLPPRFCDRRWKLAYGSSQHGVSMMTFQARMRSVEGPCVTVIRDTKQHVFGCFSPVPWKESRQYFGSGEMFVFTLKPHAHRYTWTRKNSHFLLCKHDCVAAGGGGGAKAAFYLDGEFLHGSSGKCETFSSPCLASSPTFKCVFFEVWELLDDGQLEDFEEEENLKKQSM